MRKNILAATAIVATLLSVPAGPAQALTPCDTMEIQAHRGYHYGRIDQNTVRSFDEANARGYQIETDVWHDAEGQLWIYHDRDVSKLSNGTGRIDQMTTEQVRALRYKKAGSPLPTFEEAVAAWSEYPDHRKIYLEPKQRTAVEPIVEMIRAVDPELADNIYFVSYWDYVKTQFPEFSTEPKTSAYREPSQWARHDEVMTGNWIMTAERVDAYHQAGIPVMHFRANLESVWERAIRMNFDGIMTDRPNELRAFCPTVQ